MVLHFMSAVMATAKALERQCPKCLRKQLVAPSKHHESVSCKYCSEPIPPKQKCIQEAP
jgi:ribosomal protein S27E